MKSQALFLDRDGVINRDLGYVYTQERFEWMPGIHEMLLRFQRAGYKLIVVTNQSGIARGYYSEETFLTLTQWMCESLDSKGIDILDVFFCPHHPNEGDAPYKTECDCRKPAPGMLFEAARKWNIDLSSSALIGDSWRDIVAGQRANLAKLYLLKTHLTDEEKRNIESSSIPVIRAKHLDIVTP